MRLASWRKQRGWTQMQLAEELGVSQPYVSDMERAANPSIPGPSVMIAIFELSRGAVQPNDFYSLPAVAPARREAA